MHWGGVDGWKEDRRTHNDVLLEPGIACFTLDIPGAGENPCLGQEPRAERTFSAAMDYLETRGDIDGKRIACMGGSFGGYWAAKLAHTEPNRLRGAVNWGAGVHRTFQEEWLRPALTLTASQYLMGPASLLDARSYIFGVKSLEEVLKIAPTLSLVTQGLIDQPCAPLLCINGKDDDQHPISDLYLLAEHGSPKGSAHHRRRRPYGAEEGSVERRSGRHHYRLAQRKIGINHFELWNLKSAIPNEARMIWHASPRSKRKKTSNQRIRKSTTPSPQSRGVVGGPWKALLHSPEMAYRTMHLGSYVRFESTLDHKVIEFAALVSARGARLQA